MIPPDMIPIMSAIQAGDKARARRLLQAMLKINPSAEAWYQASRLTESPEHELKCLKKALAMDPYHVESRRRMLTLEKPSGPAVVTHAEGQFAPDVARPKKLESETLPKLIDDTIPLKKARPQRKKRSPWVYVGIAGAITLSLVSSFFVLTFLGSSVPGQILGAVTGEQPVTEIDGVPLEQVEDAPLKVEPSTVKNLPRENPLSDTLTAGIEHAYDFQADAGENLAIAVQFFSLGAGNVPRNVVILDPDGHEASSHCRHETIMDANSGAAFVCQIHLSGQWQIRILGRDGESTGAYVVTMARFE